MRRYRRADWANLLLRWLAVVGLASLGLVGAVPSPQDPLLQADEALQRALTARPAERKVYLERAKRALASLPHEARMPLERLLQDAQTSGTQDKLQAARASIRSYLEALAPSPAPDSARVKQQLNAIFAEPDMFVPSKSWLERLSEAVRRGIEAFFRWLARVLGGLFRTAAPGSGVFAQWLVLVLLVLTLALVISYLISRLQFPARVRAALPAEHEALPDARAMSASEWQALARQLANAGNWLLATRAYYLGILRLLHEGKLLEYDPALTNWEHLQRLRQPPLLPSPAPAAGDSVLREETYHLLRPLTLRFDALRYGGATPDEQTFRAFESAFETLQARLRSHAVAA
ncbi:MAG: DUF4129 domain-containing protein [Armatimonadota bacterium]|nr:DUF4129 domain-containing protein [Armatimonadota bacterium]